MSSVDTEHLDSNTINASETDALMVAHSAAAVDDENAAKQVASASPQMRPAAAIQPSAKQSKRSIVRKTVDLVEENLKSMLFGGLDGITTVFVSVATVYSGNVTMQFVLIIGMAKLLSGALSMGIGDWISSKAELDLTKLERRRELWECENYLEGEKEEMVAIYTEKGLDQESAEKMVDVMSNNHGAFVDVMLVQELGLSAQIDEWGPLKNGFSNFFSFIFFGSIPLLIYVALAIAERVKGKRAVAVLDHNLVFLLDVAIFVLTLSLMGLLKSRFSSEKWYSSVFFTLVVGFIAAGSGFLIAFGLERLMHLHNVGQKYK